jgi:hypothetical protein
LLHLPQVSVIPGETVDALLRRLEDEKALAEGSWPIQEILLFRFEATFLQRIHFK